MFAEGSRQMAEVVDQLGDTIAAAKLSELLRDVAELQGKLFCDAEQDHQDMGQNSATPP